MTGNRYPSMWDRLCAHVEIIGECWCWIGPKRRHGGGHRPAVSMRVPGKAHPLQRNACRVMCELVHGPAPEGHEASHLCDDEWCCVNPDHLMWETKRENLARRDARRRADAACDPWAGVTANPMEIPF
jgi:hypothetical protein